MDFDGFDSGGNGGVDGDIEGEQGDVGEGERCAILERERAVAKTW
jgi:hypothetical protein